MMMGMDADKATISPAISNGRQYGWEDPESANTGGGAVMNASLGLAKAAVGAGALLFPSCYHRLGLVPGLLVTFLAAVLSLITLSFLGDACRAVNAPDFQAVAKRAGGHRAWPVVAAVGQFALLFGPLLVYLSIIGQYVSDFVQTMLFGIYIPPSLCQFLLGAFVVLPLTLRANTKLLNRLGVLGMFGMCYVAILCVIDALFYRHLNNNNNDHHNATMGMSFLVGGASIRDAVAAVPMIVFSFSSHLAFPILLQDMPSTAFAMQTILGSVTATCAIYVLIGVFGYSRFGSIVHGQDVLKVGHDHGHLPALYLAAEVVVAIANLVSCPILILSLVSLIKTATFRGPNGNASTSNGKGASTPLPLAHAKIRAGEANSAAVSPSPLDDHKIITIVLLAAVVTVPFAGSIGHLLDILGALFGTPVALLLPSWFYLQACQPVGWKRHLAHACMFLGAFLPLIAFL
jgi:amino acid permease